MSADAVKRLVTCRSTVPNLPVVIDVHGHSWISIDGAVATARGLARAMICQLAVLHSPEHVKIVAVVGDDAAEDWEWLKWLPHHRHSRSVDGAGAARMTYRSMAEVDVDGTAHVVVLLDGGEVSREALGHGVTVVAIGTGGGPVGVDPDLCLDADGSSDHPDQLTPVAASTCARLLARHRVGTPTVGERARSRAGWAALNGLGDLARVDPSAWWRPRTGPRRLRVAIGVSEAGDPVELDIKEAAHGGMGPHGLCVGATGSGKSEFLRTLALGLVATHPPEALNLVLVDFKGGATFLGFERLRHVAAVITNLSDEAHLVARMKDALAGEMTRRQQALRAAGNFANVTDYEAARATGAQLAPLPVLFIVVDEFSELLSQQPDFADLFTAIGRVGRSLGMHLLLASQRLDEGRLRGLENHLSYRICLKTFSAAESRAVLGTPDAYDLPSAPGAAYLKTADGRLTRFRTEFVSAPVAAAPVPRRGGYAETPTRFTARPVPPEPDGAPRDRPGHPEANHSRHRARRTGRPGRTRAPGLVTAADELACAGRRPGVGVAAVTAGGPDRAGGQALCATARSVGRRRRAGPVGTSRSSAARGRGSPPRCARWCWRWRRGTLPRGCSSTGWTSAAVCSRAPTRFPMSVPSQGGSRRPWSGASSARCRHSSDPARHGCAAPGPIRDSTIPTATCSWWSTAGPRSDRTSMASRRPSPGLPRHGLAVGVHVVVSASRWVEIRPALKDHIGTRIELVLGDPADSEMDRHRARLLGNRPPGRGITRDGLDMVIALPRLDGRSSTVGLDAALQVGAEVLRTRHPAAVAPPVELLPTKVTSESVAAAASDDRPPTHVLIGLAEDDLRPLAVDFGGQSHLIVLGETECGKTATLRTLCQEIVRRNAAGDAQILIVDPRRSLLGVVESDHLAGYAMSVAAARTHVAALVGHLGVAHAGRPRHAARVA